MEGPNFFRGTLICAGGRRWISDTWMQQSVRPHTGMRRAAHGRLGGPRSGTPSRLWEERRSDRPTR